MDKSHKFVVLDAFRGVAALIVVAYHIAPMFGGHPFGHGYLAVDFFFMLSGFVLTHSYQGRLDQGWGLLSFLKTRVARLYPLYFAGMVLSLLLFAAHILTRSPQAENPARYFLLLILGVFFIPSPVHIAGFFPFIFPLNPPAWSLFYEMVVNALHAAFGRRRTRWFLIIVSIVAGACLVGMTLTFGSLDAGETLEQFGYALVRVVFAYTIGSLLCRLWKRGLIRLPSMPLPAMLLLLAAFALPVGWHRAVVDIATTLFVFPCVLLMGATATPTRWMVQPSLILGRASYGIYVLHVPLAALAAQIWFRVRQHSVVADAPWSGLVLSSVIVVLVLIVDRIYDLPARRWMAQKLHIPRVHPAVHSIAPSTPGV